MKRFTTGLLSGLLIGLLLASATLVLADSPIKLIVNGNEVQTGNCPPQIVNGHTLVPARALAEALGCTVSWDEVSSAVIITSAQPAAASSPAQEQPITMPTTVTESVTKQVNNGTIKQQSGQSTTTNTTKTVQNSTAPTTKHPLPEPGRTPLSYDAETQTYRYMDTDKDPQQIQLKRESESTVPHASGGGATKTTISE